MGNAIVFNYENTIFMKSLNTRLVRNGQDYFISNLKTVFSPYGEYFIYQTSKNGAVRLLMKT